MGEGGELMLVQNLAEAGGGPPDRYVLRAEDRQDCAPPVASDVPIIDLRRLVGPDGEEDEAEKLRSAVQSWGLFQVIGHELSPSFLDDVQHVARKFFQLPSEVKYKYSNLKKGEFQLEGYGNDIVATENQIIDWNDRLYLLVQPDDKRKLDYWPESPSSFREILYEYTMKTRKLSEYVLLALAKLLKLDEDYFVNQFGDRAEVFARFNYYPCCSKPNLVYGIKPHSDGSVMTILLPDKEVEGLQVLKDGNWVKVPIIPNALLINLGNQMEIQEKSTRLNQLQRTWSTCRHRRSLLAVFFSS